MRQRILAGAVLAALATGCDDCNGGGSPPAVASPSTPTPPVVAVEVIPHVVYVQPAGNPSMASFRIDARLWTTASWGRRVIPPSSGLTPVWSSSLDGLPADQRWLTVASLGGHKALVKVSGAFPPAPVEAVVSATVNGVESDPSARIVVMVDPSATGEDRLHGTVTDGAPPAAAIVDGMRQDGGPLTCSNDDVYPFVRGAPLGKLLWDCDFVGQNTGGNVAVFSPDRAMVLHQKDWRSGVDAVDVAPLEGPIRAIPVALWIAVDGRDLSPSTDAALAKLRDTVSFQATDDILHAQEILAAWRAGISLTLATGYPKTLTSQAEIDALGSDCDAADRLVTDPGPPNLEPKMLNVYYINEIGDHYHGLHCLRNAKRGEDVIFVGWNAHYTTTLAHEAGHALGLLSPWDGHTERIQGFDPTNLMTSFVDDEEERARDQLSLGQAFRMNVDAVSWLNLALKDGGLVREATAPRVACQCDPYVKTPCPRLVEDLVPVDNGGASIPPHQCGDEVRLTSTDLTHDAVALFSGHRFRDAALGCTVDAPGTQHRRDDDHVRLVFENFTHPGGCRSWLAVFFASHALFYKELPDVDSPLPWDYKINEFDLGDPVVPALAVPIHVWYGGTGSIASDLALLAQGDVAVAVQMFQGSNRTGIKLLADYKPAGLTAAGTCEVNVKTSNGINIYYVPPADPLLDQTQGHDGHWCRVGGTDYVVISTGTLHAKTALTHYLGHALGLADATAAEGFTSSNVMWGQSTDARTEFSLGQVFRMNVDPKSWLNVSASSPRTGGPKFNCDEGDSAKCPKITATAP